MAATLYQPFRDIGAKVVEVSAAAAKGESLPPTVEMPAVVLDKPLAEQIIAGTAAKVSPGMMASVKAAAAGCLSIASDSYSCATTVRARSWIYSRRYTRT